MHVQKKKKPKPTKMDTVMDDLCTRFILNCPPEDLQGGERILFQVETAWWFYEDNYREKDQSLPQFKLYGFADLSKSPPAPSHPPTLIPHRPPLLLSVL